MKKHSCSKSAAKEHPVKPWLTAAQMEALGRPAPKMSGHGFCGVCYEPAVICKMGRLHHVGAM